MAKGYGADATLVSAAYRLGASYGPADYSKIFQMQYESLAKSIQAKSEMIGDVAISFADATGSVVETAVKRKEDRDEQEKKLFKNKEK